VVASNIARDEVGVGLNVPEQRVQDRLVDITRPLENEAVVVGVNSVLGQHESIPGVGGVEGVISIRVMVWWVKLGV
jgi:hypothetical protein